MKKVAWILVSGALVAACGSGTPTPDDTGVSPADTGASPDDADTVITLADGGGGDAATTCGFWASPSETSIAAIPASCMPRCSAATLRTFGECRDDEECAVRALLEDPTPSISMSSENGDFPLNCEGCYLLQHYHCASLGCPAETFALYTGCSGGRPADCEAAVNACLAALDGDTQATVARCQDNQAIACFDARGGFLPGGARPPAPQPPAHQRDLRSLSFGR